MKKINQILALFMLPALLIINSCGDSFLESSPTTEIPQEEYYNTEQRLLNALNAAYAPLQWPDYAFGQFSPLQFMSDVMSDDVRVGGGHSRDQEHLHRMHQFNATPLIVPEALWVIFYSGVNRTNLVIKNIDKTTEFTEGGRDRILAEAFTLRAYYYHWLWKLWGNVPYYSTNPNTPPFIIPQIKADELYKHIMSDLDFALNGNKLMNSISEAEQGRCTRAMAQMLRTNIALYQNDQSRYATALEDMKDIIIKQQYDLLDSFEQLWEDAGEWSKESIWEINYTDSKGGRSWGSPLNTGGSVYPKLIGVNELSNSSDMEGGWGFEPVEKSLYDLYDDNDSRKDGGILNMKKYIAENPNVDYVPRYDNTGFFNRKYLPRKAGNGLATVDPDLNFRNNYRVYRFAETLLLAAELIVRTGGNQSEADSYLNRVRIRAYGNPNITKISATLDNILLEKRLEFACEGHRFWDLVRFGKAEQVLGSRGYNANKKHLPIPASEIDKAQGSLTQNTY